MPRRRNSTGRRERPELTPDNNLEAAVEGTFPASDPLSTIGSQGARAVPAEEMLRDDPPPARPPDDLVPLTQRFRDAEAAKLALETLVRDGPLDRHCAAIRREEGGAATLEVQASPADAERIGALLRRMGGPER